MLRWLELRRVLLTLPAISLLASCGGADICLNCNPSTSPTPSRVIVTGDIASTTPLINPFTAILVLVCIDAPPNEIPPVCPTSFTIPVSASGTFTRSSVTPGDETVYFVWDVDGSGTIDENDSFALLQDPDMLLDNVSAGQTVMIQDAVINFNTEPGVASAAISVTNTPTPTPSVSTSPTPTPTP